MKLAALTILLLILIPSCTIEKRLHNRGWNVQWKKHHKVKKEKKSTSQEEELVFDQVEIRPNEKVSQLIEADIEEKSECIQEEELFSDNVSEDPVIFYLEPEDTTKKSAKTASPYADMSTSRERRVRSGSGSTSSVPIILMVLGILGLIGAIVIYFSLSTIVGLAAALFSVLLMLIIGILGLVLLLIGFTLLMSALSRR